MGYNKYKGTVPGSMGRIGLFLMWKQSLLLYAKLIVRVHVCWFWRENTYFLSEKEASLFPVGDFRSRGLWKEGRGLEFYGIVWIVWLLYNTISLINQIIWTFLVNFQNKFLFFSVQLTLPDLYREVASPWSIRLSLERNISVGNFRNDIFYGIALME